MEILCSGKPYVISNLRTFQFLNEKYDLKVDLIENKMDAIAARIETILKELQNNDRCYDYSRRDKCKQLFSTANVKTTSQILYEVL